MKQYLLATYRVEGEVDGAPRGPDEMNAFMKRVLDLEEEMDVNGVFVFGGALARPETAVVARVGRPIVTDGPFAEAKEQIAGFYIINAETDDVARAWAHKVATATNHPIELRGFSATGRVKDSMEQTR